MGERRRARRLEEGERRKKEMEVCNITLRRDLVLVRVLVLQPPVRGSTPRDLDLERDLDSDTWLCNPPPVR